MEDEKSVWNSKREIFKILQPFWTSGLDKVIVLYKGRAIFRQYIPKKHKRFGIKFYEICVETGYTYDMTIYLGRDRQRTARHLTVTRATVSELTKKIQGSGHKLYMDNQFSSSDLFDDLDTKQIYCFGTVRPNRKSMPQDVGPKRMTLQRGDLQLRTSTDLTTILWEEQKRRTYFEKHARCTGTG